MRRSTIFYILWIAAILFGGLGSIVAGESADASVQLQKADALTEVFGSLFGTLFISGIAALITYTLAIITAFCVLYFGPWTRRILNQLLNTLACISPLILLLIVYSVLSARGLALAIVLGVAIYPLIGRQVLARVSDAAEQFQFMQARILGHGPIGVFLNYAWPRFLPLTVPFFFFGFIYALLIESMFSSLGLLVLAEGDTRTWGSLIHEGAIHLLDAPWQVFYPGVAIIITTLLTYICVPIIDRLLSLPQSS